MTTERTTRVGAARFWQFLGEDHPTAIDLAEDYHEASKFYRSTMARSVRADKLDNDPQLRANAVIGARELAHLPLVRLPAVDPAAEELANPYLIRRPSCRRFDRAGISREDLGRLLWLTYGAYPEEHPPGSGARRRPVASGGALYPLEIYLVVRWDDTGERGLYHYNVHRHALSEVRDRVTTADLARLGEPAGLLDDASVVVLVSSLFWRSRFKYQLRGYRFALLEAGAFIQQMTLVAQAMGLGVLPFAGIFDDVVEEMCEIDGVDESFLNAVLLGRPA